MPDRKPDPFEIYEATTLDGRMAALEKKVRELEDEVERLHDKVWDVNHDYD